MSRGPWKTVTGRLDPVEINNMTMLGPVLYYRDEVWMDVYTISCDCHELSWFHTDIHTDGRALLCPLVVEEVAH